MQAIPNLTTDSTFKEEGFAGFAERGARGPIRLVSQGVSDTYQNGPALTSTAPTHSGRSFQKKL